MIENYILRLTDLEDAIADRKTGLLRDKEFFEKVDEIVCQLYWEFRGNDKYDFDEFVERIMPIKIYEKEN